MKNENPKEKMPYSQTPSCDSVFGQPESCYDMVNKYGTYNIQPTADTSNEYPAIAQGLSKEVKEQKRKERDEWISKNKEQ